MTNEEIFKKLEKVVFDVPTVKLTQKDLDILQKWGTRVGAAKAGEKPYSADGFQRSRRHATGKTAEYAVGKLIGVNFADFGIGHTSKFKDPDLKKIGIMADVKSANWGLVPMPEQEPKVPEIMTIIREDTVYIFGVAKPAIIRKYSDTALVQDQRATTKTSKPKTGFFGFKYCERFETLAELKKICVDGMTILDDSRNEAVLCCVPDKQVKVTIRRLMTEHPGYTYSPRPTSEDDTLGGISIYGSEEKHVI